MDNLKKDVFKVSEGDVVISNRDSSKSSSIVINDNGINVHSSNALTGMNINNDGIHIQGDINFTGKGKSIKKGDYSENPKGAKIYTHTETVYFESAAKEEMYKSLGESAGINAADNDVSGMTMMTDMGGYPTHNHTISIKHIHRVEPQYIYKVPWYINMLKEFSGSFSNFLKS
jgi:hypothetical protein